MGRPLPFACAVDAEEGASILSIGGAAGVVVYALWGDVDAEVFDDPEILQVVGDVPRVALCIDPDGPDPWLDDEAA
ncbi:MAG: hypothetical protein EON87_13640 [Brevundimonas sp.]|nr:MAG: hypothetical protein EON87_13640 [Brevundimonas sp.]